MGGDIVSYPSPVRGGGGSKARGCRAVSGRGRRRRAARSPSATRRVSRRCHGAGIHHERDWAVANPRASIATARSAAARRVRTSSPIVRAPGARRPCAGERQDRRGRGSAAPGTARTRSRRTSARAAARPRSRRRAVGQAQPLGEVVAEAVGVDPRDEHGRRQHDDEHPQGDGEGGVEVAAGEEPRRPPDREGGDEPGQHPHGDPRQAARPTGPGPRGGQRRRRRARPGSRARPRLVVQCGDRTPAGTASSAATSRASGPQRATSGVAAGGARAAPGQGARAGGDRRRPVDDVGVVGRGDDRARRPPGRRRRDRRRRPTCAGPARRWARRRAAPEGRGGRMRRPPGAAARRRRGGAGRRAPRWPSPRVARRALGHARCRRRRRRPRAREVASTSSSTVPATIVELDHCGTQAIARARSGRASRSGRSAPGCGAGGAGPLRGAASGSGGRSAGAPARHRDRSVGSRKPARASRTVDLPDPLGPTRAVRVPGAASRGAVSSAADGCGRCRRRAGWCARRRTVWQPERGRPDGGVRGRPRGHEGRVDGHGSGGPAPGTQMPIASRRSRSLSRVSRTGPSATTRPSDASTTSRSTRSTHGPRTCSTTTSVGEGGVGLVAGVEPAAAAHRRGEPRRPPGPPAPTPGRASPWARRGGRPTGRAPACRRARAAGSGRRRAPTWGCRAARSSRPTAASAAATTPGMAARGIPTFSGPKATSRPTDAATTPAPGSWSTSPTAPGRAPGATPSTVTEPVSSPASAVSSRPARARRRVDLPDPDGPTSSTRSPGAG